MAEVITETILPGTYIEVRAEGLLTVGAIATGNVGIIGTAEKGPNTVSRISSYADAKAAFGGPTEWDPFAPDDNLTLVRALKYVFDNGARTVYALRVLNPDSAEPARYEVRGANGVTLLRLTAKTPGTWGNRLQIKVETADEAQQIHNELLKRANGAYRLSAESLTIPDDPEARIGTVTVRNQGLATKYAIKTTAPSEVERVVQVNPGTGALTFQTPPPTDASLRASYGVPAESLRQITLSFDGVQSKHIVPSAPYLAQRLGGPIGPSTLVDVELLADQGVPAETAGFEPFSGGANGAVTAQHFKDALEQLVDANIQLLTVAGLGFSAMRAAVLGHVEKTENLGRERIAIMGADSSAITKILDNANDVADKRVALVAPGLVEASPESGRKIPLPPYFAAAAITGKLAGLAPHVSLTNKTLAGIEDTALEFSYGQKTALLQNRVLVLEQKRGIRVIKGISTHDEAFKQITLRRIVDYVKQGTRLGANQYIGKLNNPRVRDALFTTLDAFLSDLVTREFLTQYNLDVFADRQMEIRGEVLVTMDLYPTFSIDVIRVTMNLQ